MEDSEVTYGESPLALSDDGPPLSRDGPPLSCDVVLGCLRSRCDGLGLECHAFLVSWYNAKVSTGFQLPHHGNTLAVLVVNTPSMFERLFVPYLQVTSHTHHLLDPLDNCLKEFFSDLTTSLFPHHQLEVIQDYEVNPATRKPRILVQTAGHVAGAARYYKRDDLNPDPWPGTRKVYGVSMHPVYGGWFAFRGVLIFKGVEVPDLKWVEPEDCVPSQEMRVELLEKYNWHWKDWSFRDVMAGVVKEKYSEEQKVYFETEPKHRAALVAGGGVL